MSRRPETGPMRFGDDWPGVFVRGDNAFAFAVALERVLAGDDDPFQKAIVDGLREELMACRMVDGNEPEGVQRALLEAE